jgi:hypothetical protein
VFDGLQHAGAIRAHFEIDLLGLELDERFTGGDLIAFVLQPFRDAGFDNRFTELGDNDVSRHCHLIPSCSRIPSET